MGGVGVEDEVGGVGVEGWRRNSKKSTTATCRHWTPTRMWRRETFGFL